MCLRIETPAGVAIVCGTRRIPVCRCGRPADYQCDWKMGEGKTCDAYICANHAKEVATNKHMCPFHQHAYEHWKKRHNVVDLGKYRARLLGQASLFPSLPGC